MKVNNGQSVFLLDLSTGKLHDDKGVLPQNTLFKKFIALNFENAERKALAWKKKEYWKNDRWISFMCDIALKRVFLHIENFQL